MQPSPILLCPTLWPTISMAGSMTYWWITSSLDPTVLGTLCYYLVFAVICSTSLGRSHLASASWPAREANRIMRKMPNGQGEELRRELSPRHTLHTVSTQNRPATTGTNEPPNLQLPDTG